MNRGEAQRIADVRALVVAARMVATDRAKLVDEIAAHTGLSPQGVELGFMRYLELGPSDTELERLVARTARATRVHVVLSANVFVAPLRALAIARAASACVTVRPSRRDPTFTRALVAAARDPSISLEESLDATSIVEGEVHVYGRDATIAEWHARCAPGVIVRGHGTGMGVTLVSDEAGAPAAAEAIARDVVAFDQRGCLSPRVVVCEGDADRAGSMARCLHEALSELARSVPRGVLAPAEESEGARYAETMSFVGRVWRGASSIVGAAPPSTPLLVPPPGRHLHVCAIGDPARARELLEDQRRFVVAVGTDEPMRWKDAIPPYARVSLLGEMQRPPFDGPVDRRVD